MNLPTDTAQEFKVARVELKKTLEPKNPGEPAPSIVKLGLIGPQDARGWAEMWCASAAQMPKEGATETLILTQPENPEWALKARRPSQGGNKGGAPRGRSPQETKAIQRQHSQEMGIRWLAFLYRNETRNPGEDELRRYIDWFEKDIGS